MTIKELFDKAEGGTLNYEQFNAIMKESGAKFTDLSEDKYVSKMKYDDDIANRENQINTLNATITAREGDLAELKTQLENAGTDASKLTDLQDRLNTLQNQYDTDTKSYQAKLSQQAYEFAVKDFANSKKFTSSAAKRDFIRSMVSKELKMDGDKILGADDFVTAYSTENEDAFYVEKEPEPIPEQPLPTFVQPTSGTPQEVDDGTGGFNFHFTGVRPKDK